MSAQPYQHRLIEEGMKRLRLLHRHSAVLMNAYAGAAIDEAQLTEAALQQLLQARVLWRSDEDGSLRISHKLRELIAEMIADEQRRQAHADVGAFLQELRHLTNRYLEAQNKADYSTLEHVRTLLTNTVDDFNSRFADAIDSLWQRLNSDFGFVDTLADKIRENARAQEQARRLNDGLALIDFEEWIDVAGSHGFLRKLLVSQWQQQVSQHYSSLRVVLERLELLITRFREQQASAKLVRGMVHYLRTNTQYQPHAYHQRSQVPALFNVAAALPLVAHPQVERHADQEAMLALFAAMPKRREDSIELAAATAVQVAEQASVAPLQGEVKQAATAFYMRAVESNGEVLSAMDFWREEEHEWPADIWLFQVLSEYQGLPKSQQRYFYLAAQEEQASATNALRLVRDYHLNLRRTSHV
ncbi:MAG TPA: hypothetical protein VK099_05680 [Alcanivoracaceae bacterium]|nr:hypothetical protein [Alcanivoracaceae bacterium]